MEVGTDSRSLRQGPLGGAYPGSFNTSRTTTRQIVVARERQGPHQASAEAAAGVGTPNDGIAGPRDRWREGIEYAP